MRSSRSASSSRAVTSAVMSREIADTPTMPLPASRIGENVTETSTRLPSLRTRVLCSRSTAPPSRTAASADSMSARWSGG